MGTTAKVFIVLNLVMALIFAIGSLCLFAKEVNWVRQTRLAVDEGNAIHKSLSEKVNALTTERDALKTKGDKLKEDLEEVQTKLTVATENYNKEVQRYNTADANYKSASERIKNLESQLNAKDERNNNLQGRLDGEIAKLQAASKEKNWHQSRSIETAAELVEAENEMMQLAKNNAEMVRRIAMLSAQLEKYVARYGVDPESSANAAGVTINGKVLQVEPKLSLVILSVGEKDKVQKGMEFVISRGSSYITKVRVASVYPEMCSAKIIEGMTHKGENVQISDSASTLD